MCKKEEEEGPEIELKKKMNMEVLISTSVTKGIDRND